MVDFGDVTEIGYRSFSECSNLTNVNFKMMNTIGGNAFRNYTSLKNINLNEINMIDNEAFYNCPLESINVSENNTTFKLVGTQYNGFIQKTN
jgi:hypothetical protein